LTRIIITGGRRYRDTATIRRVLEEYHQTPPPTLVHGGAAGADSEAAYVAGYLLEWHVEAHPADWQRHGRAAGPIRNQQMVDSGADLVIAFPGGRGTADLIRRARAAGIPVRVIPPA